jgi:hypothetical protein
MKDRGRLVLCRTKEGTGNGTHRRKYMNAASGEDEVQRKRGSGSFNILYRVN